MEEHEVELIDYLRVMWKGKWLILVCFAVAVGMAAGITLTRPATYTQAVSYRLVELVSPLGVSALDNGRLLAAAQEASSPALFCRLVELVSPLGVSALGNGRLLAAAQEASPPFAGAGLQVEVEEKGDGVQLTLSGASATEGMQSLLKQFAASVEEQLTKWAREEVARTIAVLELRMRQASRQRDLLKQRAAELGPVGPDDPFLSSLAKEVVGVEARLADGQARLESLQSAIPGNLFTLDETSRSPISRIGPSLRLNLAVAGFLGLFIGVLLAFFLHYLAEVRKRTQAEKDGPAA